MKRLLIKILFIAGWCIAVPLQAQQHPIVDILQSIEDNNKGLQAGQSLFRAKKMEAKSDNNLSDPSVSYSHLYGSPKELGKSGELTISQEFDFPTLYVDRNKLNKLKSESFDKQFVLDRRNTLLQARELCLEVILLNQQQVVLDSLLKNSRNLTEIYEKRLLTGDANVLEVNRFKMEYTKLQTESATNRINRQTKLQELTAMNGNIPVELTTTHYPPTELPDSYDAFKQIYLEGDIELQALEFETKVAQKQVTVNRSGWLPKLEVGYRRDTGKGEQFNGFMVGTSIPLFANKNKVKQAKAEAASAELQQQTREEQTEADLRALYAELQQIVELKKAYNLPLLDESMQLMKQSLEAKQLSLSDYFVEVTFIYEAKQRYMELENRYQLILGQLFRNRL